MEAQQAFLESTTALTFYPVAHYHAVSRITCLFVVKQGLRQCKWRWKVPISSCPRTSR